jgi:two-component system, NtrC family, nitrogen regulation sensor histidine kinase NtrY
LRPEERHVLKVHIGEEPVQLGIQLKEIVLQGDLVKIFTLQNLSNELEEQELHAWNQLMRVLTHEIMNSVTPIVSLSSAMKQIVTAENGGKKAVDKLSEENLDDLSSSIEAIVSRSKGLLQFVHAYKEYARPIDVHAEHTNMTDIIQHVIRLFTPDLEKNQISLQVVREYEDVAAMADRVLIEQVLINLLKNAIEAVDHRGAGAITVRCMKDENDIVHVMIADNGPGIEPDTLNKIFIPFYTTKPKGSGIGLSLCRQIMHAHGGTIRVMSAPGEETVFTILWKSN